MEEVLVSPRSSAGQAHPSAERLWPKGARKSNPQDNYDASPRSARPPASNSTARDAMHAIHYPMMMGAPGGTPCSRIFSDMPRPPVRANGGGAPAGGESRL